MKSVPRCFTEPPKLDDELTHQLFASDMALLINPFYAKDSHASFGKHVLTPTLALTSIAGSTPEGWTVAYWDENLLQGHPPRDPFPQVVGITVHLTFAHRAYELATWYRSRGSIVVLGGLHVMACQDEVRPHADILAVGEGVSVWRTIIEDIGRGEHKYIYVGSFREPYENEPPPRRDLVPRSSFLTTTSLNADAGGCHSRCGFCYLSTKGLHMPYQMLPPKQVVQQWKADDTPYAVFTDNNLGSKPEYLREVKCLELRPLEKIWSAAVSVDVADDPSVVREMALAGCTGVFVGFESLSNENIRDQNNAVHIRQFMEKGLHISRLWHSG